MTQLATTNPGRDMMEYVPFGGKDAIKLSVSIVRDMVCVPTKNGHVCDDAQAIRFMMMCRSRGLNPFEGDAYLIGFDTSDGPKFNLITAHQAFLKRAEIHQEYDGMESGVIVRDVDGTVRDREGDFTFDGDVLLGAWAVVFFKHRSHPMKKRVKLSSFSKGYGRWKDDPAGMIVKCAEADALRSSFPTLLGSLYVDGEMQPNVIDAGHVEHKPRTAAERAEAALKAATGNGKASGNGQAAEKKDEPKQESPPAKEDQKPDPKPQDSLAAKLERITAEVQRTGLTQNDVQGILKKMGVKVLAKLDDKQAADMLQALGEMPDAREPGSDDE